MAKPIVGLHHVTAIASDPQRNLDFYTEVLGLRFVKRTINFDDPGTYHFYFGDDAGSPGTILTFFPWPHAKRGSLGVGDGTLADAPATHKDLRLKQFFALACLALHVIDSIAVFYVGVKAENHKDLVIL